MISFCCINNPTGGVLADGHTHSWSSKPRLFFPGLRFFQIFKIFPYLEQLHPSLIKAWAIEGGMEKEEACLSARSLNISFQTANWHLVSHSELKGHRTPGSGVSFLILRVQLPHTQTISNVNWPISFPNLPANHTLGIRWCQEYLF